MSPGVDQALCMPDVQINTLYPGRILAAQGRRCDAIEPSILVGNDEAAFVIVAHADPGTLLIPGNRVEQFNVESRQHMHGSRIGCLRLSSCDPWCYQEGTGKEEGVAPRLGGSVRCILHLMRDHVACQGKMW